MKYVKKSINYIIACIPLVYFLLIVNSLPDQVPIHYSITGTVDNYGSKYTYLILCIIPILIAILNSFFNKKIQKENQKYFSITMTLIIAFFSIIMSYFIIIIKNDMNFSGNIIVILFSFLFIYFGFVFNKIEQNKYFGIRFKATLKNEIVWEKTHKKSSYVFLALGSVLILFTLLGIKAEFSIIFMVVLLLICIVSIWLYSNNLLKEIEKENDKKK